ncbi:hypothetical protein [Asticcacaulis excentricus]|uniref:hypothetical protein n=1 Tax=Asticcacaulis excentricus TaxID=78587 RepID=UPI0018D53D26|nr:hypothetical protein [Asticcacaulis excentricus]
MAKPRVTVCLQVDGSFEILMNEAGRDLMLEELQRLSRQSDHIHLDYYEDSDIADATDIMLSAIPYRSDDTVLEHGKILFRPDEWDGEYFPHVLQS